MELFLAPPDRVWFLKGSYPMICCPRRPVLGLKTKGLRPCTPDDYETDENGWYTPKDGVNCEFGEDYFMDPDDGFSLTEECPVGSCKTIEQCGASDFSNEGPPDRCVH